MAWRITDAFGQPFGHRIERSAAPSNSGPPLLSSRRRGHPPTSSSQPQLPKSSSSRLYRQHRGASPLQSRSSQHNNFRWVGARREKIRLGHERPSAPCPPGWSRPRRRATFARSVRLAPPLYGPSGCDCGRGAHDCLHYLAW